MELETIGKDSNTSTCKYSITEQRNVADKSGLDGLCEL